MSLSVELPEEHLRRAYLRHHSCHDYRHTRTSVNSTSYDTHCPKQIAHLYFVLVTCPASTVWFCDYEMCRGAEVAGIRCPEDVSGHVGLDCLEGVVEGVDCVELGDAFGEFDAGRAEADDAHDCGRWAGHCRSVVWDEVVHCAMDRKSGPTQSKNMLGQETIANRLVSVEVSQSWESRR